MIGYSHPEAHNARNSAAASAAGGNNGTIHSPGGIESGVQVYGYRPADMEDMVPVSVPDSAGPNDVRDNGGTAKEPALAREAVLRHDAGIRDQPALGRPSTSVAQREWERRVTVSVLDMSTPEALQLVRNILTHPDVWNAARHDLSPDRKTWQPVNNSVVIYAVAILDEQEVQGVFTFYPLHWGLWVAHTSFYPWASGAVVAAATRKAIKMGFSYRGCHHIIGLTPIYNLPAVHSVLRNGFTKYCEIPQAYLRGGIWHPVMVSGVIEPMAGEDGKSQAHVQDAQPSPPPICKLGIEIDPAPLLEQIESHSDLWDADPERRNFSPASPHREMTDIWVRYADKSFFYKQEEPIEPHWWDAAMVLPSAYGISLDLMKFCNAQELGGVWITRVPAGKQIYPHVDKGWHATHYNLKVYVVLKSNDKCISYAGSTSLTMEAGECYDFDNSVEHGMVNGGETDRITLIICMRKEQT